MPRAPGVLAVVVVLVAVAGLQGSSDAAVRGGSQSGARDASTRQGGVRAQITFVKNTAHPWRSAVTWDAARQQGDGSWKVVAHESWRAGSGLPGHNAENACAKGHGWLPNGSYSLLQYDDYHGTLIHGRAFRLDDKRCADGTLREQLFIHTEAGAGNTQCADVPGDQLCRWEVPKINDYTSHGCIKMSPPALLGLTRAFHRFFHARTHYPTSRVRLVVR